MQRILELFAVHLSYLNVAGLLKRTVFVKQMILLLNILTCKNTHSSYCYDLCRFENCRFEV